MRVLFTHLFEKQIQRIKDKHIAKNIEAVIVEIKDAPNLSGISNLKKLKGSSKAYRIRIGDYRIGLYIHDDTVEFACFMNRKEIYRYFP